MPRENRYRDKALAMVSGVDLSLGTAAQSLCEP